MKAYASTLSLDKGEWREDAWDVYLLYGPEARWADAAPPPPAFWMHQLRLLVRNPRPDAPYLDAATFAKRARELLKVE